MEKKRSSVKKQAATIKNDHVSSAFNIMAVMMMVVVFVSVIFLSLYRPSVNSPKPAVTFEQKMAHLETGAPLPGQDTKLEIPRWMMAMILIFVVIQIVPLLVASHKARAAQFTHRELRQIEFLTETPLHLGLLGSLLGVCMTQFLSGTLSAPLAYLTTISGILLYLLGRFTILVSLPSTNDFT